MVVGVLINNASKFVNGSEQQPQFVIEMLRALGQPHRLFTHEGRDGLCGLKRADKFQDTSLELITDADLGDVDVLIMICHIVDDASAYTRLLRQKLQGKRVVQFHCGNHAIFNAEDVVFDRHNVVRLLYNRWFTVTWVFAMHAFATSYYELLTNRPCRTMPYTWSPSIIDAYAMEKGLGIRCRPAGYAGKLTLCCFEPNLNVTKQCVSPLLIMNEYAKRNPDRIHKCFVFCTKHIEAHTSFKNLLAFLDIAKNGVLELYPRMVAPDVMQQMRDRNLNPVVIGHQLYNDQNYLSLECLHLGYPLVHNSPSIQSAGFFYDGFELHTAVRHIETVAETFHDPLVNRSYNLRSEAVLQALHTSNATQLSALSSLLDEVRQMPPVPPAPEPEPEPAPEPATPVVSLPE